MELADYIKANENLINPQGLTLLAPYSIYQAAIVHIKILAFLGADPRCHYWAGNLYILKSLLVYFAKTWKISGMIGTSFGVYSKIDTCLDKYLELVKAAEVDTLFINSTLTQTTSATTMVA